MKSLQKTTLYLVVVTVLSSCFKTQDPVPQFEPFTEDLATGFFQAEIDGKLFTAEPNGGLSLFYLSLGQISIMTQNREGVGFWITLNENKIILNRSYSLGSDDDFTFIYYPITKGNIAQQLAALGGFNAESGTVKFTKIQKGKTYEGEFEFVGINENFKEKYTVRKGKFSLTFK
jgi:hypothetical protein